MHSVWNMNFSKQGLPNIIVHCSKELCDGTLHISFDTHPTFVFIQDIELSQNGTGMIVKIQTDGHPNILSSSESLSNQSLSKESKDFDIFYNVPMNKRYGTYLVQDNCIMYKKEYWHYPSISYDETNKPIMRNLTPRESKLFEVFIPTKE